ncbi:MAG: hypothetical protein C0502_11705 [Opitutus sp.]|nr:hypothetical protein [Opitutus sp.]
MRFQKVKGTIIDFNELEHALDDMRGIGAWQIELRKANDDPLNLDEIHLHVTRADDTPEETLRTQLSNMLHSHFEVRPNKIIIQTAEKMRELQKVGVALKEQKVLDNRPQATAAPHEPPPAKAALQEIRK